MVVACLALFVASSGATYAVARIHGSTLVDRSVRGKKIVRNSLGRAEVKESRLSKVPNADRVDGLDSLELRPSGRTFSGASMQGVEFGGCGNMDVVYGRTPFTVRQTSRIFVHAQATYSPFTSMSQPEDQVSFTVVLRDAADTISLAASPKATSGAAGDSHPLISTAGVLTVPNSTEPYVAQPGTYVLRIHASAEGDCAGQRAINTVALTYVLLGPE
jgi:hypothetical protein